MTIKGKKHISLKEAAELSGYSPDYVGQLIRSGKLQGKKVYANVAWMTTEEDLREYIKKGNGNGNGTKRAKNSNGNGRANGHSSVLSSKIAKPALFFAAGFLGAAVFALIYILSVNLDSRLEDRAIEQAKPDVIEVPYEAPLSSAFNGLPRL